MGGASFLPFWNFLSPQSCLYRLWVHPSRWPGFPEAALPSSKNPSCLLRKYVLWLARPSLLSAFSALDSSHKWETWQRLLAADIELKHLTSVVYMPVISASPRLRRQTGEFPRVRMASPDDSENLSPETKTRKTKNNVCWTQTVMSFSAHLETAVRARLELWLPLCSILCSWVLEVCFRWNVNPEGNLEIGE